MAHYREKPKYVEAFRIDPKDLATIEKIVKIGNGNARYSVAMTDGEVNIRFEIYDYSTGDDEIGHEGDWVVIERTGVMHVFSPGQFEMLYDTSFDIDKNLIHKCGLEDYTLGLGSNKTDAEVVAESPCQECGNEHVSYFPFAKSGAIEQSYRAFAVCEKCGSVSEF